MPRKRVNNTSKSSSEVLKRGQDVFPHTFGRVYDLFDFIRHEWQIRGERPVGLKYSVAIVSVLIAFVLKIEFFPVTAAGSPYILFFSAIMFSAWYGGFKPGIFATLISTFLASNYFLDTSHFANEANRYVQLGIFMIEGFFISLLSIFRLQVEEVRAHMVAIVESSADAIIGKDLEGRIISWNKGATKIYGYNEGEVVGQSNDLLVPADKKQEWKDVIRKIKKGRDIIRLETNRYTKDGRKIDVLLTMSPIINPFGKIIGVSTIAKDITQRKERERRRDEFISVASHELKTPVTGLLAYLQLANKSAGKLPDHDDIKQYCQGSLEQVERLNTLVNNMLDISRIQSGKFILSLGSCRISDLVRKTAEEFSPALSTHRVVIEGEARRKVVCDEQKIRQVIINLLNNAIKYSPKADKVTVRLSQDKTNTIIAVEDYGIGIAPENQSQVFERFYRVSDKKKVPGLGVGLYISSEIIRQHGGRIWLTSQPGKGSIFYFSLPISKKHK